MNELVPGNGDEEAMLIVEAGGKTEGQFWTREEGEWAEPECRDNMQQQHERQGVRPEELTLESRETNHKVIELTAQSRSRLDRASRYSCPTSGCPC